MRLGRKTKEILIRFIVRRVVVNKDDDTIKKIYDTLTYDEKILADEKIKKMLGKIDRIDKTDWSYYNEFYYLR